MKKLALVIAIMMSLLVCSLAYTGVHISTKDILDKEWDDFDTWAVCTFYGGCSNCTMRISMPDPWCHSFSDKNLDGYTVGVLIDGQGMHDSIIETITNDICSPDDICIMEQEYQNGIKKKVIVPRNYIRHYRQ